MKNDYKGIYINFTPSSGGKYSIVFKNDLTH